MSKFNSIDYTIEALAIINKIKRNPKYSNYSYMLYDFSKISHKQFVFKMRDPLNPSALVPVDLDLPSCGKKYNQSDLLSTVMTQVSRYSKNRDLRPDSCWYTITSEIADIFKRRFLRDKIVILSNDRIAKHINPVIEKLAKSGAIFQDLNVTLRPLSETYTIHFFLKDITKVVMAKSLDADKCGQGISAWSKTLNALFCPLMRAIEECFTLSLKDNVIYENGIPEAVYDTKIAELFDHENVQFVNDFKEYDSNQDATTQLLEDVVLEIFCDKSLLKLYRAMRLRAKQKSIIVTLINEALKNSGESGTLFTNSILCFMFSCLTTDVRGVSVEGYKGDDSFINAKSVRLRNILFDICKNFRGHLLMKSDVDYPLHTDFAGNWLSEFGIIPDMLKILAKVLSKDLTRDRKCALTLWERNHLNVEGLPYYKQIQMAMRDKLKFLNEKKVLYLEKIYADVYNMKPSEFNMIMSAYKFYAFESERDSNKHWSGFYVSDCHYQYDDMTEADKNMKRIKATYGNLSVDI